MRALSARLDQARSGAAQSADYDADRARLAEALDRARAREAELETAAQEASDALSDVIEALRAQRDRAVQIAEAQGQDPEPTETDPEPSAPGQERAQGRYSLFDWEDGEDTDDGDPDDQDASRGGTG